MVMTLYKPWWRIMRARNVPFANVCQPLVTALDPNTSLLLFFPQTQSHWVALEPQNDSSFSHFQCFRGSLRRTRDFSVFSDLTRLSVNSSFLAACLHLSKAVKWGNSDAGGQCMWTGFKISWDNVINSFWRDFACFHETKQKREVMGRRLRLRDGRVGSAAIVWTRIFATAGAAVAGRKLQGVQFSLEDQQERGKDWNWLVLTCWLLFLCGWRK